MLFLPLEPDTNPVRTIDPVTTIVPYGDNYKQRYRSSINAQTERWDLVFSGLSETKAAELDDFLDEIGRDTSFGWISPDRQKVEAWFVDKIIPRKYLGRGGQNFSTYTITIERDYGTIFSNDLMFANVYLVPLAVNPLGANTYLVT